MWDCVRLLWSCYSDRTIPTSYNLEGVVREGDHSQRISKMIELWKGRYNDKAVTLKVLKVSLQDPHILTFKSVSMSCTPQRGLLLLVLTCDSGFAMT